MEAWRRERTLGRATRRCGTAVEAFAHLAHSCSSLIPGCITLDNYSSILGLSLLVYKIEKGIYSFTRINEVIRSAWCWQVASIRWLVQLLTVIKRKRTHSSLSSDMCTTHNFGSSQRLFSLGSLP